EFGQLVGIVSPLDLLEAIAGEFPDEDEQLALQQTGPTQWRANGSVDLHQLEQVLAVRNLMPEDGRYTLLSGLLLHKFGRMPEPGEKVEHEDIEFRIEAVSGQRIEEVSIQLIDGNTPAEPEEKQEK